MAIIFTYPTKVTPTLADTIVITDSESEDPEDRTKQISIASIKDTINVVDSLNALTGAVTITGGTNVTLTTSGNNIQINSSGGGGGSVPGGSTGSVQFKNSSSEFAGDAGFTFTNAGGVPKLIIGDTTQDTTGIIEIQSDDNGAELKIGGGSQTYYTSIRGSDSDTASYGIILPPAGPGGNNKILESTSAGVLSWINTPSGTSYSAGNGLDLTGTTFSLDLKANGGLVIQSTELALDLAAASISTILGVGNGGTGSMLSGALNNTLIGDGSKFVETKDVDTAIQLPVGNSTARPAAQESNVGLIRYNSSLAAFEGVQETSAGSGSYSWVQLQNRPS